MKSHEFFHQYANLPLDKRIIILDRIKHGELTMNGVYFQLEKLENEIRPLKIKEMELLKIAEEFLPIIKS